jgi:hypothetical protein
MKKTTFIVQLICFTLLLFSSAYSQTSKTTEANGKWTPFWQKFSVAIKKKDVAALRKMMPEDFNDGGGGLNASEWLAYINENEKKGSWRDIQRSMAAGTVNTRSGNKGVPTRVTKDKGYYFEFRNGVWYFAAVGGD